jgi:hypothetical protein
MNGYVVATYLITLAVLGGTALRIAFVRRRLERYFVGRETPLAEARDLRSRSDSADGGIA